ncbi:unnamed protein product (macronuclear) [Paramecium tetraurelia]|uniref:HSF-type DNA-binding domain-containing protein n=1 Tax=Paramecium tetraurelia TaxID=5888 RepID=A0D9C0_PARTE|nr:uncharacterized protein GSPATT00014567001 [Paramecium tetraurelia]CAK79637.1 unnamed protein product [Paramecium tetraurelia]|eukprot:XP_001447034.1 hypothetical protein (macronuclear) [Paramecium tetraurelia strain d4-2]
MTTQSGPFSTPAFIIKLYDILDEQVQFNQIIKWSDDGEYFIVLQPKLMENEILLQYFKHNHYQSFLRQLNMYEFIKARNSENYEIFSHPFFKRGNKKQLSLIKRNPIKTKCKVKKELKSANYYFQNKDKPNLKHNSKKQSHKMNKLWINTNKFGRKLGNSKKTLDVKIDRISYLLSFIIQQQGINNQDSIEMLNQIQCKQKQDYQPVESLSPLLKMMQNQMTWNLKVPTQMGTFSPLYNNDQAYSPLAIRSQESLDSYQSLSPFYQQFKEQ